MVLPNRKPPPKRMQRLPPLEHINRWERETNAETKMQLLWECHNNKRIIRIPTLPIQAEVLCTMPQVPTYQ